MITIGFLVLMLVFSVYGFNNRDAMQKYLFHPYSIYKFGEHYRFLSHAFLHGDFLHLAFNSLAFYSFGMALEEYYFPQLFGFKLGKLYYILLFTGGIYAASVTEYFRNRKNPSYSSLGASGAISSVIFCYIMLSPLSKISFFFFPIPGWIAGILLLGISTYLIRRKKSGKYTDNISHESHFWGAIFGILFILILKPAVLKFFFLQIMQVFS